MQSLLNLVWIALLLFGLALSARPVARQVRRTGLLWISARQWEQCKTGDAPAGAGTPFARLRMPTAGINTLVLRGADPERLHRAPCGDRLGAATLILAHRDSHFRGLRNIAPGDPVEMELRSGIRRTYRIADTLIVDASDAEQVLENYRDRSVLILITCYPFTYMGPAPSRFLVLATPL